MSEDREMVSPGLLVRVWVVVLLVAAAATVARGDVHLPKLLSSNSGAAERAKKGDKRKGHGICHDPSLRDLPSRVGLVRDLRNRDALRALRDNHKIKFGTCAVVGNAGNLQATKYGAVIDSHDMVFRMNQAPTRGYEDVVGRRASFRLINKEWVTEWVKGHKWLPKEEGLVLITRGDNEVRRGRNKYTSILGVSSVKKDVERWTRKSGTEVMQFNKSLAAAAWKKILAFQKCIGSDKKCDRCKATSGMLAIISAVILCDRVTVYGMGGSRFAGEYPYQ